MGHEAGDRLLQTVAVRLASCIREADMLARLGGDEFVILVENFDDASYLSTLAERIVQVISEPFHLEGNDYYLGVSIGVSIFFQTMATTGQRCCAAPILRCISPRSVAATSTSFTPRN
ncbi:diguanylate cyclase domain-containing protein [Undibacterium arcticum]